MKPVPFTFPPEDLVPEIIPDVPLCGTDTAPLSAIITWRAEIDTATLECSNAAAEVRGATFTTAAAKSALNAAMAAHDAARDQESNARVRSSNALKRRQFAWDQYLTLCAEARSVSESVSPTPSVIAISPAPRAGGSARAASPVTIAHAGSDVDFEVFEGLSDDVSEVEDFGEDEAMES